MPLLNVHIDDPDRTFVVGDIHGQDALLAEELARVEFNPQQGDTLYALGDLIDRGPKNAEVVTRFTQPGHHVVLGNHDAMFLALLPLLAGNPNDIKEVRDYLLAGGLSDIIAYVQADNKAVRRGLLALMPDIIQGERSLLYFLDNGGGWYFTDLDDEAARLRVREQMASMTLHTAIELNTPLGRAGLTHATVPNNDWHDVHLITDAADNEYLWDRTRSDEAMMMAKAGALPAPWEQIAHIDLAVMGHTVTPFNKPVAYGNSIYLDTGAARGDMPTVMSVSELFSLLRD